MISKEEMINHIDKSMNTLKEDLKNYIDESVKENEEYTFYDNYFKSNKLIILDKDRYNFYLDEVELGDIVFGIVYRSKLYGCDIMDKRYPFKVIYKDNDKLILEGIKNIDKKYTFDQACKLRWDVRLMVDGKVATYKNCTIISKKIIKEYGLDKEDKLSGNNLGTGFHYWTNNRYDSFDACYLNSSGSIHTASKSYLISALPCITINL